jgi:hypothetical protein
VSADGWYEYRVANAHHEEVGVSADRPTSAPASGAAAAASPVGAPMANF